MLHLWMIHLSRMNELCYTFECVIACMFIYICIYEIYTYIYKSRFSFSHVLVLGNSRHKQGSRFVVLHHVLCCCTGDWFHWKCYTPEIHQIQKLQVHGTNSNQTKITIWICTARYGGIWVSRFGGFRGCSTFSGICHMNESRVAYKPVTAPTCRECVIRRKDHVARMNESCLIYECIMSLLWIGHVTQTSWAAARDVSRHREWAGRHCHVHRQGVTCERVMWHVNESCDTYEKCYMRHITQINKASCHTHIVTDFME